MAMSMSSASAPDSDHVMSALLRVAIIVMATDPVPFSANSGEVSPVTTGVSSTSSM